MWSKFIRLPDIDSDGDYLYRRKITDGYIELEPQTDDSELVKDEKEVRYQNIEKAFDEGVIKKAIEICKDAGINMDARTSIAKTIKKAVKFAYRKGVVEGVDRVVEDVNDSKRFARNLSNSYAYRKDNLAARVLKEFFEEKEGAQNTVKSDTSH